jgi:antitoxin component YwqK of YwqJK toxin-antitoxin module
MNKKIVNKNDKGQLHGIQIGYHYTAKIWYKENYINGQLHGIQIAYYSNGQINYKEYYIYDKLVSKEEWIAYERKLKMVIISNL